MLLFHGLLNLLFKKFTGDRGYAVEKKSVHSSIIKARAKELVETWNYCGGYNTVDCSEKREITHREIGRLKRKHVIS